MRKDKIAAYLEEIKKDKRIPEKMHGFIEEFVQCYLSAVDQKGCSVSEALPLLTTYFKLVSEEIKSPFSFPLHHKKITEPFDYYQFGIEVLRPLVLLDQSKIYNEEHLEAFKVALKTGENVILLANHQIEPDPQAIALILESVGYPLGEEMIFVAGHKVTTDPIAIPFSKGCNILSIYSKNYIDSPPEEKEAKIAHNRRAMRVMRNLLDEGGKCIYVAPSGGRDRPNAEGVVQVHPFDPQSIEMFRLIAERVKPKTHFYPLALSTYPVAPPPPDVIKAIGEKRLIQAAPIYLAFGEKVDFQEIPLTDPNDKIITRQERANHLWGIVNALYQSFPKRP